jgi:hypothetical protein
MPLGSWSMQSVGDATARLDDPVSTRHLEKLLALLSSQRVLVAGFNPRLWWCTRVVQQQRRAKQTTRHAGREVSQSRMAARVVATEDQSAKHVIVA